MGKYYNNRPTSKLEQIRDSVVKIHERFDPEHDITVHDEGEPGYYNDRPKTKLEVIRDAAESVVQVTKNPSAGYSYEEQNNVDAATFVSQVTAPVKSLTVSVEPVQSGSGTPAPDNVRTITGWTAANIYVSPTNDPADGTTYSAAFPAAAGTVYYGTLDVTAGTLTVERLMFSRNTSTMNNNESYPGWKNSGIKQYNPKIPASGRDQDAIMNVGTQFGYNKSSDTIFVPGKTQTQWKALAIDVQILYQLVTPITYQLTPQQITTLLGTNNVWANTGGIKNIKYPYAEK